MARTKSNCVVYADSHDMKGTLIARAIKITQIDAPDRRTQNLKLNSKMLDAFRAITLI